MSRTIPKKHLFLSGRYLSFPVMNDWYRHCMQALCKVRVEVPMIVGLKESFNHPLNGMTEADMHAVVLVATRHNEIIIFRSTGPWARRWIEAKFPTKSAHVKGKSSDWGPHAGLIPHNAKYSKIGSSKSKVANGNTANQEAIDENFAGKVQLQLSREQLMRLASEELGIPKRKAIDSLSWDESEKRFYFKATRQYQGSSDVFSFCTGVEAQGRFKIFIQDDQVGNLPKVKTERGAFVPLEVMTSLETTPPLPITGDYDLFAVCPKMSDYGNYSINSIRTSNDRTEADSFSFPPGSPFDKLADPTLSTYGQSPKNDYFARMELYKSHVVLPLSLENAALTTRERASSSDASRSRSGSLPEAIAKLDKLPKGFNQGLCNITPRILRCVNALNAAMSNGPTPLRRVHHSDEATRHASRGAITKNEMEQGEGFPITVFQPQGSIPSMVENVLTLVDYGELVAYVELLENAGFFMLKNWVWGIPPRSSYRIARENLDRFFKTPGKKTF